MVRRGRTPSHSPNRPPVPRRRGRDVLGLRGVRSKEQWQVSVGFVVSPGSSVVVALSTPALPAPPGSRVLGLSTPAPSTASGSLAGRLRGHRHRVLEDDHALDSPGRGQISPGRSLALAAGGRRVGGECRAARTAEGKAHPHVNILQRSTSRPHGARRPLLLPPDTGQGGSEDASWPAGEGRNLEALTRPPREASPRCAVEEFGGAGPLPRCPVFHSVSMTEKDPPKAPDTHPGSRCGRLSHFGRIGHRAGSHVKGHRLPEG